MRLKTKGIALATAAVALLFTIGTAEATNTYMNNFRSTYPAASGTRIDSCSLCHTTVPSRNSYGAAFRSAGHSFGAVEGADSDGDGFSNLEEINALFFPGDLNDHPASAGDTTAPTIVAFSLPPTASSLTVTVSALSATDDTGVAGYLLKESAGTPAPGAAGWTASAPGSFTFPSAGARTLYAWAKDAAGNVSNAASATVTITLPPTGDTTAPTIDAFDLPPAADSLTVSISALSASDDTGVAAYLLKESPGTPAPGSPAWTASPPASYTFPAEGTRTLYAWAKDAAGNVSNSASDTVTITLAPPPPPGSVLFTERFNDATRAGDPDWDVVLGRFSGIRGQFVPTSRRRSVALVAQQTTELDPLAGGRIEADLRFSKPTRRSSVEFLFDYQDASNYRYARLDWGMKRLIVGQVGNFGGGSDGEVLSVRLGRLFRRLTKRHRFRIDLDPVAGTAAVFVDGAAAPLLTKNFPLVGVGRVGVAATQAPRKAAFDNVKIWGADVLP